MSIWTQDHKLSISIQTQAHKLSISIRAQAHKLSMSNRRRYRQTRSLNEEHITLCICGFYVTN